MGNSSNKQSKSCKNMSSQKGGQPGYPSQGQGQGYPSQQPVNYQHQPPQYGAPPAYAPPAQPGQPQAYMQVAPNPHYAQQLPPPAYNPQTVCVQGGFEAGARFDVGATPNIPPPPPGVMPNQAQMAAAQGHNVVMSQQKTSFISGGGDGGYSVW